MSLEGLVDSGATYSLFPIRIARSLGLADRLIKAGSGQGVAKSFRIFGHAEVLEARIVVATDPDLEVWGPPIQLRPRYYKPSRLRWPPWAPPVEPMLLGRADFFAAMRLSFSVENGTSMMTLEA